MRHNPLFIKREKRSYQKIHWCWPEGRGKRTFCGYMLSPKSRSGMSEDKNKVNCSRCIADMRLHGHLSQHE